MDSYDILVFLHVAAVVVALGATFGYPFLQGFAERRGVAATRTVLEAGDWMEKVLVLPGGALVFLFGLGIIFDNNAPDDYKNDMPAWLTISVVWFVVAYAVAIFVRRRQVKAAIATLKDVPDGPTLPDAYAPLGKRIQMVGGLLGLSIVVIAFLMVTGARQVW